MSNKLDLGSGRQSMECPYHTHLDKWAGDHIEYVWDLNNGLPKNDAGFPVFDSSLDEIRAHHVLEHIHNLYLLMDECWLALKPTGVMKISVPNGYHLMAAYSDPTHVRTFVPETFNYFTEDTLKNFPYSNRFWEIIEGPTVNGESSNDKWEIYCALRPVK